MCNVVETGLKIQYLLVYALKNITVAQFYDWFLYESSSCVVTAFKNKCYLLSLAPIRLKVLP